MNYHNIKEETKDKIMETVECKLKAKEHICVENLLSQLPSQLGNDLKRHICLNLLKDVSSFGAIHFLSNISIYIVYMHEY